MAQRTHIGSRTRRAGERRVLLLGLLASTMIHGLLLAIRLRGVEATRLGAGGFEQVDPEGGATVLVRIVEETGAALRSPPALPIVPIEEDRPTPDRGARPGPENAGISPEPGAPTAAEILRPRLTDPRLAGPARDPLATPPPRGRRVSGDADAQPTSPLLRDPWAWSTWSATDAAGLRWGAAPGVLYLAGIPIPLCGGRFDASSCGFGLQPIQRDEYRRSVRMLVEIRRQQHLGEILERGRAIRARRGSAAASGQR